MSKDFNRALSNGITAGREDSRWKDERIAELEAERRELVEAAYREGYEDGETVKGGVDKCWDRSDAQYALAKIDKENINE